MHVAPETCYEPKSWIVVFHPHSATWLANAIPGRWKHVSAIAYAPWVKAWVLFDPQQSVTQISLLEEGDRALAVLSTFTRGCGMIRFAVADGYFPAFRFGFWCVPAIKHLLGLSSGALRPDALWRALLANGGEILSDGPKLTSPGPAAGSSDRSKFGSTATASNGRGGPSPQIAGPLRLRGVDGAVWLRARAGQ